MSSTGGSTELWVGIHVADADILVFDPAEQPAGSERVRLFSTGQAAWRQFDVRETLRRLVRPERDPVVCRRAIDQYLAWIDAERERQIEERARKRSELRKRVQEEEARRFDAAERRRRAAESSHRAAFRDVGQPYPGVRRDGAREQREAHCFRCKERLDSTIDSMCNACGWMLCLCGACGCSFMRD